VARTIVKVEELLVSLLRYLDGLLELLSQPTLGLEPPHIVAEQAVRPDLRNLNVEVRTIALNLDTRRLSLVVHAEEENLELVQLIIVACDEI